MASTSKAKKSKPTEPLRVRFWRSSLPFPTALVALLIVLTALKISGTSVGVWSHLLYGADKKDTNLLAGHPRYIRSDEWELNTPMTVGQTKNGLARTNQNVGHGQDMSLIDMPYKDWSVIFKPQNLAFFVLPLEHAFAFKWWLLGFMLIICCYYLFLFFVPDKRLLAALFSLSVFFSPFMQWWSLGTITLLFYGMAVLLCALHLLKNKQTFKHKIVLGGGFAYLLTCFGLLLYPPFQIPIALVGGAFLLGVVLNNAQEKGWKETARSLRFIVIPGIIASCLVGLFLATRLPAIRALNGTVYPGHRVVPSGGFEFSRFFSGPILGQLQNDQRATKYGYNQSEASNFILFPFLLAALAWIAIKYRRDKKIDWRIVGIVGIAVVFLLRLFSPFFPIIPKVLFLDAIPHARLLVGFGLITVLSFILIIEYLHTKDLKLPKRLVAGIWLATLLSFCIAALDIKNTYPEFIGSIPKILFICLATSLVTPLLLYKKFTSALGLLLAVSFVSTCYVNPLYRGLGPLVHSDLSKEMQAIGNKDKDSGWVVSEPGTFENMAIANGLRSISGVYIYPQLSIWEPLKKQPQDEATYNRFAHVFFTIDDALDPSQSHLEPPALDAFRVRTSPCSDFLEQNRIRFILTTVDHHATCVTKVKDIPHPNAPFKVYRITESP